MGDLGPFRSDMEEDDLSKGDIHLPPSFREDLETLINRHSKENGSDTPDFILADYLIFCLNAFDQAVSAREKWYGREERLGKGTYNAEEIEEPCQCNTPKPEDFVGGVLNEDHLCVCSVGGPAADLKSIATILKEGKEEATSSPIPEVVAAETLDKIDAVVNNKELKKMQEKIRTGKIKWNTYGTNFDPKNPLKGKVTITDASLANLLVLLEDIENGLETVFYQWTPRNDSAKKDFCSALSKIQDQRSWITSMYERALEGTYVVCSSNSEEKK